MDFSLSTEQKLLKESAERFVDKDYPFPARRKFAESDEGFSRETWARFAELGWLGAGVPEAFGGSGGGGVETAILMEAFGRALCVEPYLTTAVLGGGLIAHGGTEDHKRTLLPELAAGKLLVAFAFAERDSRYDLAAVAATARTDNGGFVISGEKSVVFNAATADRIAVSARTGGATRDSDGISLFLVARDAPGLSLRDYSTVDGLRASELALDNVRAGADDLLGEPGNALPLIERVIDGGIVAVCAEAVGIMAALYDATLAHLKTRRQFDRPIGDFQVLQHRMVDMLVACELSRSMAYMAAVKLDEPAERRRAASAAKVQIGRAGRFVGQQAVQLHGGMGMTDELSVGHYFKRLTMIDTMFGDADHHLQRFAGVS